MGIRPSVPRALLLLLTITALAISATLPNRRARRHSQIGQTAPAFLVATLDGESITADFHGKPAYIDVFATWCSPCRRELPAVIDKCEAISRSHRLPFRRRTRVDDLGERASRRRFDGLAPVAVDRGQFAATFDVGGLPWNIFIDRSGVVQYVYRGRIPADVLANQLSKLLSS